MKARCATHNNAYERGSGQDLKMVTHHENGANLCVGQSGLVRLPKCIVPDAISHHDFIGFLGHNTLAQKVDGEGNVRYDVIAHQGQRHGKLVQSQFKGLVPLAYRKDIDEEDRSMERPSEEEVVQATAERTRAALENISLERSKLQPRLTARERRHLFDTLPVSNREALFNSALSK